MSPLEFTLGCIPTAQARPRHTSTGRAYKGAGQLANERTLEALLAPHVPEMPLEGGIELDFTAIMPIPKSAGKKRREDMLKGQIGHTVKPDLDNLTKQLMDAMTRLRFWNDDRQIERICAEKTYGDNPRWEVRISQRGEYGAAAADGFANKPAGN